MSVPEIQKAANSWCPHAKHGNSCGACTIYHTRPDGCRDFLCMWLNDSRIPDYWYPAKCKIVISTSTKDSQGQMVMSFIVDPSYPNRWREEPWFSDIKTMAKAGLAGTLGQRWTSIVLVGDDRIPILA
jgi:hypothetical protein